MAVGAGVAAVEEFHGFQVDLAALHAQTDKLVHAQVFEALDQGALHEFVYALVFMTENGGVVGVGGNAFESVNKDLLQGAQVLMGFQRLGDAVLLALGDRPSRVAAGVKVAAGLSTVRPALVLTVSR